MDESDAELIRRSVAEPEAFGEIFERHFNAVFKMVARCHGADRAGDATSEVFLAAFRIRERFDSRNESCKPWLYGIASNVIGDSIRKQRRAQRVYVALSQVRQSTVGHAASVEERVAAQELNFVLNQALASLPKRDRDVFLLRSLADQSYQEIAEALSIPVGTVRSRLNRARKRLAKSVSEPVWGPPETGAEKQPEGGPES